MNRFSQRHEPADLTDWLQDNVDEFAITFTTHVPPLSNWSAHRIFIWGKNFPTAEHAYQYKKFVENDPKFAEKIRFAKSPWIAKKMAWSREINTKDWNVKRVSVMKEVLYAKLEQHEDVRLALGQTENLAILESGNHPDNFWGIGRNNLGKNTLGKMWMLIRDELKAANYMPRRTSF